MPSSKQLALQKMAPPKLAILSLACLATVIGGCDRSSAPQGKISQAIASAQIAAATGEDTGRQKAISLLNSAANTTDAPDASVAQAKAALAEVQLQAASDNLKLVNQNDLAASRIALQIAALGAQLGSSQSMVEGYNKLEPKAAKVAIDQKITEAKGDAPDSKWINDNGTTLPSLAAVTARISQLQSEISKKQADVKALDDKRKAALADAETSMKASESAKDQASVDAFIKSSNSTKQAADLQTQIDVLNASITPLQQDLAVAQGQQQTLQKVVAELTDESQTLDEGWQGVQNKIQAQIDLMKQIATAPSNTPASTQPDLPISAAGGSIADKSAALAQANAAADKARDDATKNLEDAIKDFKDAQTAASSAVSKLQLAELDQPNLKAVYDQGIAVIDPQAYRYRQANAQRTLAAMQISQAGGLDARIKLRDMLVPILQSAQLSVPKEIDDPNLAKQLHDTTAAASQNLDEADQQLVNVIDGPPGMGPANQISSDLKKSALVSRIFVIFNQQLLATIQGNTSLAQQKESAAHSAVNAAVEAQATFPSLPADYATYLPAPTTPAAPTTGPASTPTTAPSADAGAATESPDVQAIHTTITNFVNAFDQGDPNSARQYVQIEPGQEEFYKQTVALLTASEKFSQAMQTRFGNGGNTPVNIPNFATIMENMHPTVKGDEAYASDYPGGPEEKEFVRVNGQWKLYLGPPDASDAAQRQMFPRITTTITTITDGINAGKYATPQDVQRAFATSLTAPNAPANPTGQANATTAPTTPAATPQ